MVAGNLALPYRELTFLLNSTRFNLTYQGIVQVDGRSVHDVRAEGIPVGQHPPHSFLVYHTIDIFIDASTLQVYMVQDAVPRHAVPRQIRYSNYTVVNGILVPFSIDQQVGGERTFVIHLNQISFNVGLQDSTFDLNGVAR
jgi:hypothetical protein